MNTSGDNRSNDVDIYLTQDGNTIAGRKKCFEYMNDQGYPMEDINKNWKFNWNVAISSNHTGNMSPKRQSDQDISPGSKRNKG